MSRTPIKTDQAPAAIGPYSQAVVANGIAYLSGQIAIDPKTQKLIDGDLKEQALLVMENLKAVLAAAGSDFSRVIKTSIFLAPDQDFGTVNEVYEDCLAKAFPKKDFPARETVWVHALPKNVKVEISMIAMVG